MRAKTIFILNALIAAGYGLAFLAAASPLLAVYGIAPNRESIYMARWFGVGWIAVGFNLMLGVAFGYLAFRRPVSSHAAPKR